MRRDSRIYLYKGDELSIKDGISDAEIIIEAQSFDGDRTRIFLDSTHLKRFRETLENYVNRRKKDATHPG